MTENAVNVVVEPVALNPTARNRALAVSEGLSVAPSPKTQLQEAMEPSGSELASVKATSRSLALNAKSAVGGRG
ncbi:MAG: hypothetical protein P8170_21175 [Gemmatimonadota bacterium]